MVLIFSASRYTFGELSVGSLRRGNTEFDADYGVSYRFLAPSCLCFSLFIVPRDEATQKRIEELQSLVLSSAIRELEVISTAPHDVFFKKWPPFLSGLSNVELLSFKKHCMLKAIPRANAFSVSELCYCQFLGIK